MLNLIVNFTPTGMIPTKDITPHVPISCGEIVEQVHEAIEIGITMVHLHAREESTGQPDYHAETYQKIITGIRQFSTDLIICVSLSGRTFNLFEQRIDALTLTGDAKPDMGSLTLGSVNFNHETSVNTPQMIQALAEEMRQRGILPELEVFDLGMINYAKYLEYKGILTPPYYINLILGNIACSQADALHIGVMLRDLPQNSFWSGGGIGNYQLPVNSMAIAIGGGVRVGIEDNIWYDSRRTKLATNSELIKRVHQIAELNERSIMQPGELRQLLKLCDGTGHYGRQ